MSSQASYQFYEHPAEIEDVHAQLLTGFRQTPRSVSPKFFYDERGSELFTAITRTEDYYPTRMETGLLKAYGKEMAACIGPNATLLEYGSGSSEKIRTLLEILRPSTYVPMDISRDYLAQSANTIAEDYPWLDVHATCVDYSSDFDLPVFFDGKVAAFFPGSSIGNFTPDAALSFLKRVKGHVGENGGLLIGVDLKKDVAVLNRAYNDSEGITAEFNLNVLNHINEAYQGNFDLDKFQHRAAYNESLGCIQMFVTSTCDQVVDLAGESFHLQAGEEIHTENSFKYGEAEFRALCRQAGFAHDRFWTDEQQWFGVFYVS
ncbi:MAG: dimethylhistidine N-methyltransferase [Candidatus Azotimanducaceae bacterium]|jgi:dimethylhistidine N-methyltransferase